MDARSELQQAQNAGFWSFRCQRLQALKSLRLSQFYNILFLFLILRLEPASPNPGRFHHVEGFLFFDPYFFFFCLVLFFAL